MDEREAGSAPDVLEQIAGKNGEMPEPQGPDPIKLRSITVKAGRMVCEVIVADERFRTATPKLAAFACGRYPDLPRHACVNGEAPTFGYVMEHTSVPHLLEHIAISEQTHASESASARFVGSTEWVDEDEGIARIEISFFDDLEALRAFTEATRFLNIAVLTCLA